MTLDVEIEGGYIDQAAYVDMRVPIVIHAGFDVDRRSYGAGRVALPSTMRWRFLSDDSRYHPGATNLAQWEEGLGVVLQIKKSGDAFYKRRFAGHITSIIPRGDVVDVVATGGMFRYERPSIQPVGLETGLSSGQLISRVIKNIYKPITSDGFVKFDHPDEGQFDNDIFYGDEDVWSDIDEGLETYDYPGDTWTGGQPVRQALQDVCASELGFFWLDRDGNIQFAGRDRRQKASSAYSLDRGDIIELAESNKAYWRGGNEVLVQVYPREQFDTLEVVWEKGGNNLYLDSDGWRQVQGTFRDEDEKAIRVAAWYMEPLLAYTDYEAADRDGNDITEQVFIEPKYSPGKAIYNIRVAGEVDAPRLTTFQQRGKLMKVYAPVAVRGENYDDAKWHGLIRDVIDMPLQESAEVARQVADYVAARFSRSWMVFKVDSRVSDTNLAFIQQVNLGDLLDITDSHFGRSGYECFVEKIAIEVHNPWHISAWVTCSPASAEAVIVLDSYVFNDGTYFAL